MSTSHYFSADPGGEFVPQRIRVELRGREVELTTAGGVFSPDHLDTGTRILLDEVPDPPPTGDLVDLGCGWGPVALALALASPAATVWAVDVNERALALTRANAAALGLRNVNAVTPDGVPDSLRPAALWSNPPIRIGKEALHALLLDWLPRLAPGADAWLVVSRNLGADSLHRWLTETLPEQFVTERTATGKGFRVLRVGRDA